VHYQQQALEADCFSMQGTGEWQPLGYMLDEVVTPFSFSIRSRKKHEGKKKKIVSALRSEVSGFL
jgi:hypothetical protein